MEKLNRMNQFIIHYHEIALKKGNRAFFVEQLVRNIKTALKDFSPVVTKLSGRLLLEVRLPTDAEIVGSRTSHIPGIANFLPIEDEVGDLEELKRKLAENLKIKRFKDLKTEEFSAKSVSPSDGRAGVSGEKNLKFKSFRISTKRGDKTFPLTSEEVNREIGSFVQEKIYPPNGEARVRVDLDNPELTIHIEIVNKRIFFGFEKIQGVGGLPVGSSGKVVCLLSGGIDSPVASYMMMRRGCKIVFVHFHAFPYLDSSSQEKAKELVSLLDNYQQGSKLYFVPLGDIQKKVVLKVPEAYRVVIYRRLMFRIAEEIAKKENPAAAGLVTGESLGQVASQTLENISVIEKAVELSVLRPLIGMCKEDIIKIAREIETYEISIRLDQDCCQLFIPKHPVTKSDEKTVKEIESKLDIKKLIDKIEDSKIDF